MTHTFALRHKVPLSTPAWSVTKLPLSASSPIPSDVKGRRTPPSAAPALVFRSDGRPAPLDGVLAGRPLFLILSGPSNAAVNFSHFAARGIVTMAVNNAWSLLRPNFWVGVDPPGRFLDTGWKDPFITKFVPWCHSHSRLRYQEAGVMRPSKFLTHEMPSTYYFHRNNGFDPATFFHENCVSWGTFKDTRCAVGILNSRSVMLAAVRLAHYLGCGTLHLVGADFKMPTDPSLSPYAFSESKDEKGRVSNNRAYQHLNARLSALPLTRPFRIVNCTPNSGLTCYPYVPLRDALLHASLTCSKPVSTQGWYS